MGLHLNFELRLNDNVARADALARLDQLRGFAATTNVDGVSRLVDLANDAEDGTTDRARACIRFFAECLERPIEEDGIRPFIGDAATAMGFVVDPGEGAETATFGLMRHESVDGSQQEWFWWCGCKTQYASVASDAHLVTVHTALIAILDRAGELGFDVVVHDETGYWKSRSVDGLIAEVHKMNRLVARFAGALGDALGDGHPLHAPIFEHRQFEHLEMERPDTEPPRRTDRRALPRDTFEDR
jgi:hypothetical protein